MAKAYDELAIERQIEAMSNRLIDSSLNIRATALHSMI